MKPRKKLIEVALPLEAINKASAREKSIRHGHPSTLHLWWARRPLAAARAVIFAQMVDDPSSCADLFPTEKAQEKERKRLFRIIEALVEWENIRNERVLSAARAEIWQSWRRTCADFAGEDGAKTLFDRDQLPAFHDPFAGGGSLPLEAQRLGLEPHASDLNPVAVLINKAMIELPARFVGLPPVRPAAALEKRLIEKPWAAAAGLAEDIRYYGRWLRDEAEKRLGKQYPAAEVTAEMAKGRQDLKQHAGKRLPVIAWIWARTVPSPDPAQGGSHVPLIASYWLCKKPKKSVWIEPQVQRSSRAWTYKIMVGDVDDAETVRAGTKAGRGDFRCLLGGAPIPAEYVRECGKKGKIAYRLIAVVADAPAGRLYLPATATHELAADVPTPHDVPTTDLPAQALGFRVQNYGYTTHASLYTPRQLLTLCTMTSLVDEARDQVIADARASGLVEGDRFVEGGSGAVAYADAVAAVLGLAVSRRQDRWTAFSIWNTIGEKLESNIRLSAVPMTWEFAECNPFSSSTGNFIDGVELTATAIEGLGLGRPGMAEQGDVRDIPGDGSKVICTDPPYFDNIPYADLSDLFYVWLRRAVHRIFPDLMSTVLVPKASELVADSSRHGGREGAERYFLDGMGAAMAKLRARALPGIPITLFYAFKQSESDGEDVASTGWDTFLTALIEQGLSVAATWPIRTEQSGGLRNVGRNSLATSVVLACRPRPVDAPTTTRREFVAALKAELPGALAHLQRGNIAPVDLAQAAIGPGMSVYTRYAKVLDADGKALSVRGALMLINQTLDEALAEQEGDFDADSRFALAWFEHAGFESGEFGVAETLSKAKNTSVQGLKEAGILDKKSPGGKVRLLRPAELPADWDPLKDKRLTDWEVVHHLIRVLESGGEDAGAALVRRLGAKAEPARELAYRLYAICERRKRSAEALTYNGLVQSWPEIARLAREGGKPVAAQETLFAQDEG